MKKLIDKRRKKVKEEEARRGRNGSWVGCRPVRMRDRTKYTRKGRRVDMV